MKTIATIKSLLAIICLLLSFNLQAQISKTINVETAGKLSSYITDDEKYQITNLTITGNINGIDIRFIREMAGVSVNGVATKGKLSVLNLLNTSITDGGIYYDSYVAVANQIGYKMFANCNLLTSITLPKNISKIGEYAFYESKITSIAIPETVSSMENNCFSWCTLLTSITIPSNIISIPSGCFYQCRSLSSITIPNNVKSLGLGAFGGCSGLSEIHCKNSNAPSCGLSCFENVPSVCKLYIPKGSKESYSNTAQWLLFTDIIEVDNDNVANIDVIANSNTGGFFLLNNQKISNLLIESGSRLELKIMPDSGYEIDKVLLNKEDITGQLLNNCYTVSSVSNNLSFEITFKMTPVYLTINCAESGAVKIGLSKGDAYTCEIIPTEGWSINTATFNGEDITSQLDTKNQYTTPAITANSTLSISFESTNTTITQTKANNIKIYTEQNAIVVTGTKLEDDISVYTESGALLQTVKVTDNTIRVAVPVNHTYLVRASDKTFKVAL